MRLEGRGILDKTEVLSGEEGIEEVFGVRDGTPSARASEYYDKTSLAGTSSIPRECVRKPSG